MLTLNINGQEHRIDAAPDMPLLWVIRDLVGLKGTKFGCGIAQCGSCTVLLNGVAQRSCALPVSAAVGQEVTTIEGLDDKLGQAVKTAWEEVAVPQCGYCQSGQIMTAAGLLAMNPNPSDKEIADMMSGNICRCCTYHRINKAVRLAADKLA